ncbi:MAG: hypothetical protein K0R98_579 [Rickettsiaceae bacterium]|nr:hypothetical protein [Rickettsiaceae bacterium]
MVSILKSRKKKNQTSISSKTSSDVLNEASISGISTHPLDLEAVCNLYDIKIFREPMDDKISGTLERMPSGHWVIRVNSYNHPRRQRFTIAHELGHFFLHRNSMTTFIDESFARSHGDSRPIEVEANRFAASLLMPKEIFSEAISSGKNKISELADYFETSMFAIEVRAKELGYRV